MNECPPEAALRSILEDDSGAPNDERLMEHVSTCDHCQARLESLFRAAEADWLEWKSALHADDFHRPGEEISDTVTRETVSKTHSRGDAFSRTLPDVREQGADVAEFATAPSGHRDEFGDYRILDKLGVGGMGVVYLAKQKSADRVVALKIIRPEQLATLTESRRKTWLDRFRSEAQAAARLEHDHIVRVYEVGQSDGVLFYSMQYIEGQTLSHLIRKEPIENKRLARLMNSIALAVDFAHQQGILHRDLKPHNILIRGNDEARSASSSTATMSDHTSVEDVWAERAYVADFGLAKNFLDDDGGSTHTGEAMGSPSYMSPEQATDASRCTPASDVYSLGATLYDALTGRPPFRSASPLETLRQVISEQPVAPRDLNPAIDRDLQTITMKALEKDPARRYASARRLAEDLARYVKGQPIEARPVSPIERLLRLCRRNPAVSLLTVGVASMLIIVATEALISSARLKRYAQRESVARMEAENYFVMSLDVIEDMLAEFGDESLAQVPQMESARRELLEKALTLYVKLSKSKPSNPKLRIEFAETQFRIGKLYDLLGETEQSREAYAKAIVMFDDLLAETPADPELRHSWAKAQSMLGETLRKTSPADAHSHLNLAIATQRDLLRQSGSNLDYHLEFSRSLNNLGLLLSESGDFNSAEQQLVESIDQLQQATRLNGIDDLARAICFADLGRSQINLGVLLRKIPDRINEAEMAYSRAIANLHRASDLDPKNRDYRFRMAVATVDLANFLLRETKDGLDEAIRLSADAAEQFSKLCEYCPAVPVYRYEHANARNSAAVALATAGRSEQAMEQFEMANLILVRMQAEMPGYSSSSAWYSSLRGRVFGGIGFLHSLDERWQTAKEFVEQAIKHQQNAVALHPDHPEFSKFLDQHRGFMEQVQDHLNSNQP